MFKRNTIIYLIAGLSIMSLVMLLLGGVYRITGINGTFSLFELIPGGDIVKLKSKGNNATFKIEGNSSGW